ncbi:hypothetical protein CBL_01144 [Carabus blaptoides fortunei]
MSCIFQPVFLFALARAHNCGYTIGRRDFLQRDVYIPGSYSQYPVVCANWGTNASETTFVNGACVKRPVTEADMRCVYVTSTAGSLLKMLVRIIASKRDRQRPLLTLSDESCFVNRR